MLLINKTLMLIVVGKALGSFTRSGNVIAFSVDPFDFCGSFMVQSNTLIKIYIGHDVLHINEVYNVIERNSRLKILTTIWYEIFFRTQNGMNCKLFSIMSRVSGFVLVVHHFLQREKFFKFDKGWVLKSDRRQVLVRKFPVVGYVSSQKKRFAVAEIDF